jgi:hypothetical protein
MAKTDTFFIRQTVNAGNTAGYNQEEIDLGAFVDALGKSVLRIHSVESVWSDDNGASTTVEDQEVAASQWQLTTQSQDGLVRADNKSLIASGRVTAAAFSGYAGVLGQHYPGTVNDQFDIGPQQWKKGYLIGVDSIYLGGSASSEWSGSQYLTVLLECTVETLSANAAMALALSQQ